MCENCESCAAQHHKARIEPLTPQVLLQSLHAMQQQHTTQQQTST
jgi:hypothetical protein